jgi:hypothetical protein
MTPVWVHDLADHFWRAVGPPPPFPRDLHTAATNFGLTVLSRPGLTLDTVRGVMTRYTRVVAPDEPDRPLRACLCTVRGRGFVFLDSDDPPAERRFSLAHEIAHFLRDADAPRRAVAATLGADAVRVLDGAAPNPDERVRAVLRGVTLTAHVHLLSRDDDGRPKSPAERASEAAADRLAFELLAPAARFDDQPAGVIAERLAGEFGLPPGPATDYLRLLRPPAWRDPLLARLA